MNIEMKHVKKYYDERLILKEINLSIMNSKSIGIIGESGCGKSTLLRQLAGMEKVDSGCLTVNNNDMRINDLKEYQAKIGYVFQNHSLFPHMSVRENIMVILHEIKGWSLSESEIRCREVIRQFKLVDIENQIPKKISGGQAQRASIARAISAYPELIFLDEPTAALDPLLTKEVLEAIKILKNSGTDFVFVTHEMDFLMQCADYFVFMDDGEIIEHGPIENIKNPSTKKLYEFMNR